MNPVNSELLNDGEIKEKMLKKRIDIRMDPKLLSELNRLCNELKVSKTLIIERALRIFLDELKEGKVHIDKCRKKRGEEEKKRVDFRIDPFLYSSLKEYQKEHETLDRLFIPRY